MTRARTAVRQGTQSALSRRLSSLRGAGTGRAGCTEGRARTTAIELLPSRPNGVSSLVAARVAGDRATRQYDSERIIAASHGCWVVSPWGARHLAG
jgi:hypothetical protein